MQKKPNILRIAIATIIGFIVILLIAGNTSNHALTVIAFILGAVVSVLVADPDKAAISMFAGILPGVVYLVFAYSVRLWKNAFVGHPNALTLILFFASSLVFASVIGIMCGLLIFWFRKR